MKTVRIITSYTAKYTDPLIAHAGESVTVGKRDDEWPGWVWCTSSSGKASWVHESFLEIKGDHAIFIENYNAKELDVSAGELLTVLRETGGWLWCKSASGARGWIPAENAKVIE
jgi:uncharacterized protein YgiM (DUF1202 family)